nr:unnamed protein product [Digitaria exilis]
MEGSSSPASSAGGGPQVAVAVRGDGRGSRRAARWVAATMVPAGGRVALVHVIPPVSFVPSPSGERVPVEKMEREVVEIYAQDCRARAQEVFIPFRRLFARRTVETVVLEGNSVAEALKSYAVESGVRSLVVGSASLYWLRSNEIRSQPLDEMATLTKELKDTLMMYDRACENLAHAKEKIQILSGDCREDVNKVQDALQREEELKLVVSDEKTKHLQAIGAVEMAKESFAHEAYSKHRTEFVANMVSTEKARVVDTLLSSGKSCRRYSREEIELATDYFSDAKKIGEGGYGNVYRCTLDHTEVAVKVIQQDSSDKIDEFVREIIFEISCGLAFLHGTKPEPIVHRDLKPGNILLDKNYVSKIGDVGFAKLISDLVPEGLTEYRDTVIAGTLFYMDPEYQLTGTVRPKSDLYALGIIILQLLTGKRPHGLVCTVEEAIEKGIVSDILDRSQTDWPIVEAEMLAKLGLRCTALKCRDRPNLESEVLPELENILSRVAASLKLENIVAPSHFICPILQEVMEDPYVAADGHTYEHRAIKAWLTKHKIK